MTALAFLSVLTVVVFVHEMGHFLVARWCGVKVKAFSIGFGQEIWGFIDKQGTRWRIAWIPLGGYVKFMDDENAASMPSQETIEGMTAEERAGSFHAKPVWQRAAVVAAGPLVNFLFAIVIFAIWAMVFGIHLVEPRVGDVTPDSPAARAGFKAGDLIQSIGGRKVTSFEDMQRIVTVNVGRALDVTVDRSGTPVSMQVTPELKMLKDGNEPAQARGRDRHLAPAARGTIVSDNPVPVRGGLARRARDLHSSSRRRCGYRRHRHAAAKLADQMGGPILMAAGRRPRWPRLGIEPMLRWIAFISANIGFLNLLPIPSARWRASFVLRHRGGAWRRP